MSKSAEAATGRALRENLIPKLVVERSRDEEISKMRSDLIFGALAHVNNRYQLCQLASKATRKLHKPTTRLQDTTNEVLVRFRYEDPAASSPSKTEVSQVQQRRAA
jgi:hypothetical protein